MENTTIEKLSSAVTQLMDAYDKLQQKYKDLETQNTQLSSTIKTLNEEKENLENKLSYHSDTSLKQSSKMTSILDKIESVLSNSSSATLDNVSEVFSNTTLHKEATITTLEFEDKEETEDELTNVADLTFSTTKEEEPKSGLDLNRMESLLNGLKL